MVVNININTTFFKTRHGLFKIVEFVRRRSVSTNLILSQVLVLVVLMIVRFDKNYQFGPVGDSGTSGIGESNFLATAKATLDKITSMGGGSGGGMGDGDFLGMVSLSMLSTPIVQCLLNFPFAGSHCRLCHHRPLHSPQLHHRRRRLPAGVLPELRRRRPLLHRRLSWLVMRGLRHWGAHPRHRHSLLGRLWSCLRENQICELVQDEDY